MKTAKGIEFRRITIDVDPETWQNLNAIALERKITLSALLREIFKELIKNAGL